MIVDNHKSNYHWERRNKDKFVTRPCVICVYNERAGDEGVCVKCKTVSSRFVPIQEDEN